MSWLSNRWNTTFKFCIGHAPFLALVAMTYVVTGKTDADLQTLRNDDETEITGFSEFQSNGFRPPRFQRSPYDRIVCERP